MADMNQRELSERDLELASGSGSEVGRIGADVGRVGTDGVSLEFDQDVIIPTVPGNAEING